MALPVWWDNSFAMLSMSDTIVGSDSTKLRLNFLENSKEMAFLSLTNSSQVWSDMGFDSSKYSISASEMNTSMLLSCITGSVTRHSPSTKDKYNDYNQLIKF